jgi:hypothetical protein
VHFLPDSHEKTKATGERKMPPTSSIKPAAAVCAEESQSRFWGAAPAGSAALSQQHSMSKRNKRQSKIPKTNY